MTDANEVLAERWPTLATYVRGRWAGALAQHGLEVGDVLGELALRLSRAAPWDPTRGTIKRWLLWHTRRCVLDLLRKHSRHQRMAKVEDCGGADKWSSALFDAGREVERTLEACGPMTPTQRRLAQRLVSGDSLRMAAASVGASYEEARGVRRHLLRICQERTSL